MGLETLVNRILAQNKKAEELKKQKKIFLTSVTLKGRLLYSKQ